MPSCSTSWIALRSVRALLAALSGRTWHFLKKVHESCGRASRGQPMSKLKTSWEGGMRAHLTDHVDLAPLHRECPRVERVRVDDGPDLGPRLVDGQVERDPVDVVCAAGRWGGGLRPSALWLHQGEGRERAGRTDGVGRPGDDVALDIDLDQGRHVHAGERDAGGVNPERAAG